MLSLHDLCLNTLESYDVLPHNVPWQLSQRNYYRRPLLKIFADGLCNKAHCMGSCQVVPGWWSFSTEYSKHAIITIKYNGQYRFSLRQSVKHGCCTACDEKCHDELVFVENYTRDDLKGLLQRINGLVKNFFIRVNKEDPLYGKVISCIFEREIYNAMSLAVITYCLEKLPHTLL